MGGSLLDTKALAAIKPVSDDVALARGAALVRLAGLSKGLTARPVVTHTQLTLTDTANRAPRTQPLDSVVSYNLALGGLPVSGQGAKLRLTVGPDGRITQLSAALRKVVPSRQVPIIGTAEALKSCTTLYGRGVRQLAPTLGYQFPELTAFVDVNADGTASAATTPGGGGFGALAIPAIDVGIEQTVDEWQCAQDIANGFKSVMAAQGVGSAFDFRGTGAWESDFKDQSLPGGHDNSYVG